MKADEAARRKYESTIQDLRQKISKYRDQMLDVKTNEQYKAFQHELTFAEKDIAANEDKILELMINAGLAIEIKAHGFAAGQARLTLWQAMPEQVAPGDGFTVTAGCDKSFATCRARFANTDNFRGFPQIPGNDFLLATPTQGAPGNEGASLGLFLPQ